MDEEVKKEEVKKLADLLEKVGFEYALIFLEDIIIKKEAIKKKKSLRQTLYSYVNTTKNEQPSEFQLRIALSKIEFLSDFKNLEIDEVITKKPSWII